MTENDKLRQALKDMLKLLESAEACDMCCGPAVAFDPGCTGAHKRQWKLLEARIRGLLKQGANKPN